MKVTLDKLLELQADTYLHKHTSIYDKRYNRKLKLFIAAKKRFSDNMLGLYAGLILVSINTTDKESANYIDGLIERNIL